jgi:hypothetical protein
MNSNNGDMPAMPLPLGSETVEGCQGLTKREMFCLHMGVADTGDEGLDAVIRTGNRQKIAMGVISGISGREHGYDKWEYMVHDALELADALLAKVELSE